NSEGVHVAVAYHSQSETEQRVNPATGKADQFIATVGIPPITAPDSAGLSRVQRYRVTELRGCNFKRKGPKGCKQTTQLFGGNLVPTAPSNIGPKTLPNYGGIRAQAILTDDATQCRVFAGQNAETFAIDLGAVFDTAMLRVENATPIPGARPPLPVQTAAEDANDFANPFGFNAF